MASKKQRVLKYLEQAAELCESQSEDLNWKFADLSERQQEGKKGEKLMDDAQQWEDLQSSIQAAIDEAREL